MLSCGTQKIVTFEYSVVTRGYKKTVAVSQKETVVVIKKSNLEETAKYRTSGKLWKALQINAVDIDLNKISSLKSPTNKRDIDAAMFAKLIIVTKGSTYTSSSFDNGHPPKMIKTIVDSLANLEND